MPNWLFASGECTWTHDFGRRERADFRRGSTQAYMEEIPVLPGIWLYRAEATGRSRFSMEVGGGEANQGRFVLGVMLAGRGAVNLEGCDDQLWGEDGRSFTISPIERRVRYDISTDHGWRSVGVRLERGALDLLGPDGAIPDLVMDALSVRRDNIAQSAPLSGPARAVSNLLLRSPYEGAMRRLFQQSKALELLVHLFERLESGPDAGQELGAAEVRRVRLARDRLLAELRDPPDLETLALDVGLSPKRLNRGFRALYGTTVFDYLRDARLEAALEAGTPLTLKQLAWELGYGQASNFATAFRRRFGVSPGLYRRQDG